MRLLSALAISFATFVAALPASGAEMTYYLKNSQSRSVVLELRARDRDKMWPGDGQVYQLDAGQRKSVIVSCNAGETICYGGWIEGNDQHAFGVGPDDDRACTECCAICVDKTTTNIVLDR